MGIRSILLCAMVTGVVGGGIGFLLANRADTEESAQARQERDACGMREHELRGQLEEALAAQAALTQEKRQLEATFTARIKRLEEIANQLVSEQRLRREGRGE